MKKNFGFTLIELVIIITFLAILGTISFSSLKIFRTKSELDNSFEEMVNVLRRAQSKTLVSEGLSQYGIYFDNSTTPHQFVLFKGQDYASRDIPFDEVYNLPLNVEIYEINLNGKEEVVFNKVTGDTNQSGEIYIRLKNDPTQTKEILIYQSGGQLEPYSVGCSYSVSDPDLPGYFGDSRHVHFDYSRMIDTANESLTLTFEGGIIEIIVIADNLKDGQIYWEGTVDVSGGIQKVKIHTHRLNNPDTQFSVHRDRKHNTKSLTISISGDKTGNLIEYSADGLTTNLNSSYASELSWQ